MSDFKREINHNMKRRAPWHNYSLTGTYHITLVVESRRPLFGKLCCTPKPHIELSSLGQKIADEEIGKIHSVYPNVKIWAFVIMPDHIHLIVRVNAPFPEGKHLGKVVIGFKSGCNNAFWNVYGDRGKALFEKGYNDGILKDNGQLDRWKNYLCDNPRRLALKCQNPQYFTVMHDLEICGRRCQITGNRFLLNIPDKMAVIVHRADSEETHKEHCREWLACGDRGGVLVSASIAPREKEVLREAMNRGYRIILLRENGFPSYYKPAGEAFDACSDGRLLQISPWQYHFDQRTISRSQCLYLNDFAQQIAQDTTWY